MMEEIFLKKIGYFFILLIPEKFRKLKKKKITDRVIEGISIIYFNINFLVST